MTARQLQDFPIHLGHGAAAVPQPRFDGTAEWYAAYGERHAADGAEGRLVSLHRFTESWTSWEMHPAGAEVVVCIEGEMELVQEFPGGRVERVRLSPGDYAINPPGVWHTADIAGTATGLFITSGEGTENRPR